MSYFYDKLLFRTNFYEDVALMFIFLSLLPARSSETKQHKKQLCTTLLKYVSFLFFRYSNIAESIFSFQNGFLFIFCYGHAWRKVLYKLSWNYIVISVFLIKQSMIFLSFS